MIIVLDLETTWVDIYSDSIIEISLLKVNKSNFEIIDEFSSLINPWFEISEMITSITWIENEDLKVAPQFQDLKDKIIKFIWNNIILGHNVSFDINFLKNYQIDLSSHIILDTFVLANFIDFDKHSLSLEYLALAYDIKNPNAHRAYSDTKTTLELFKKYIEIIKNFSKEKKEILYYIFSNTNDFGFQFLLKNYLSSKKITKIDFTIFSKIILRSLKNTEINKLKKERIIDNYRQFLSKIKSLEIRKNQEYMMSIVDITLNNKKLSTIEAPTWIWKTFAYLIPSILFSLNNNKQVIISTTTKTLQDQIFYKDLVFLKENLWVDFSYSKLKWKSNYISIFKFFRFFSEIEELNTKQASFILKISFWLLNTKSYELDELNFFWEEFSFKKEINAEDNLVFSKKNIYNKFEPVIFFRKNAKNSNIVIINNSILFSDIIWDNSLLWKIDNLVLDEAHNLEDVISNSLKKSFSLWDLDRIYKHINIIFQKNKFELSKFNELFKKIIFNFDLLFDIFISYFNLKKNNDTNSILIEEDFYKIKVDNLDLNRIKLSLKSDILSIIDLLKITPEELYIEIINYIRQLDNIVDIIDIFFDKDNWNKFIKTINKSKNDIFYLEYTILNIADFLQNNLWDKLESCILTSATLSINNSFDYLKNFFSLQDFDFYKLDSDFDYEKQALIFIPTDIWNIKNNFYLVLDFLKKFLLIVRWNTLVLFTSLLTIKEFYVKISIDLKKENIKLYAQSIWWWKHKLLEFYKKDINNSIIFGTDSFWEGVNLVWDELKYLIIHKIPFTMPNDPYFKARTKLFKDSFYDYSIPKAIIKLKQWFWRLIRSKKDKWIVIFLDNRIFTTKWGRSIYSSFPDKINIIHSSSEKLLNILTKKQDKKK